MQISERIKSLKHILESQNAEIEFFTSGTGQTEQDYKELIKQIEFYDNLKRDFLYTTFGE